MLSVIVVGVGFLVGFHDLDKVRVTTRQFKDAEAAETVGYFNVNVGECVESSEGVMVYQILKEDLSDLELG
ncbi:MAG: hypothetical protein RQ728_03505 [Brevefilum sp.]|nr:hypothetical protein [Brevefilum sp.]MDT8381307.1 hypothetical protein [Brevefilum sp.]